MSFFLSSKKQNSHEAHDGLSRAEILSPKMQTSEHCSHFSSASSVTDVGRGKHKVRGTTTAKGLLRDHFPPDGPAHAW